MEKSILFRARRLWPRLLGCGLMAAVLLCGCQQEIPEDMREKNMGEAARMEDGQPVYLWEDIFGYESYRLEDGTVLLDIRMVSWPWNSMVAGLKGYEGMSGQAQQKVRAYYEGKGELFDRQECLKMAYADYRQCREEAVKPGDSAFRTHPLWQESYPTYETARFTAFCTTLTLPKDGRYDGTMAEARYPALFDRETGERMDSYALFTLPKEEIAAALFDRGGDGYAVYVEPESIEIAGAGERQSAQDRGKAVKSVQEAVRSQKEAFIRQLRPEYLCWGAQSLEICFPPDVSDTLGWTLGIPYADLEDILQPWALPEEGNI